jgi:hypothetical protein
MTFRSTLLTTAMVAAAALAFTSQTASAANVCPAIGVDTNCGVIVTVGPGGAISSVLTGQGPYDGVEDTLIGVINNSGAPLSTLGKITATTDIFGFDGDGIDTYHATPSYIPNPLDHTGYGGPDTTFVVLTADSGFINFSTPIANGGSTFFSLEESITLNNNPFPTSAPEPASMALFGVGLAALGVLRRRKSGSST